MGPPGSTLDRGMCVEKRTNDRPEEDGALNSGDPRCVPSETIHLLGAGCDQRKEDAAGMSRESDPLIVVRDGSAVHTAKGRAEGQLGHSTHARDTNTPSSSVSRTLSELREKAERAPEHRFRALCRLLDRQMLKEAFASLRPSAAPGIDGVYWADYAKNLELNLTNLEQRLKAGRYRAQCVKRRWIPKAGSKKLRPLGIPVLEDKIVQQAVSMILGAIWEADFVDESIGYRPGRGAQQGSLELREALDSGTYRWVVEADIRGFFDHVNHGWILRMLAQRIADRKLLALIAKWLKAGVMEHDGRRVNPATGTPQGGVISPILANIYLHFVQDLWIKRVVAKHSRGQVLFRRYADDSVVCFEYEGDARTYLKALPGRLAKFGLELAAEKSSLVKFNRWEPDHSGRFAFLGFDYYWARTRKRKHYVVVKMRTNREKFRASLRALTEWIKEKRSLPLSELLATLRRKLQGYWNYFGVIGNSIMLARYHQAVYWLLFKWLNRRSQRKSFTWKTYQVLWPTWNLPAPKVRHAGGNKVLPKDAVPA